MDCSQSNLYDDDFDGVGEDVGCVVDVVYGGDGDDDDGGEDVDGYDDDAIAQSSWEGIVSAEGEIGQSHNWPRQLGSYRRHNDQNYYSNDLHHNDQNYDSNDHHHNDHDHDDHDDPADSHHEKIPPWCEYVEMNMVGFGHGTIQYQLQIIIHLLIKEFVGLAVMTYLFKCLFAKYFTVVLFHLSSLHQQKNHIGYICSAFLHCMFSNVWQRQNTISSVVFVYLSDLCAYKCDLFWFAQEGAKPHWLHQFTLFCL